MEFRSEIASNQRKSIFLLISLFLLLIGIIYLVGLYLGVSSYTILPFALLFSMITTISSYWSSDKLVLMITKARVITEDEGGPLYNIVSEMAIAAGIPMPKVAIVEDSAPNAFATGRDPNHAIIAFTTGILAKMDREQLQGVAAHEMSHIKNRDTLVATVAAVTAGAIALIADLISRVFLYSGGSKNSKGNPFAMVALIIVIFLAPIGAILLRSSISRKREALADSSAVAITRNPTGLRRALETLRDDSTVVQAKSNAVAHLWVESPIDKRNSRWHPFDTHPPIQDRIDKLQAME